MDSRIASYTAASGNFPIKILKNYALLSSLLTNKHIKPIHLQLNPTNKCNLNCKFCSCSEREKSDKLSKEQITRIFSKFCGLGCKSATITGGGEPLLWEDGGDDINWIIEQSLKWSVVVGIVTNGYLLHKLAKKYLEAIVWVRISASDETDISKLFSAISDITKPGITDWSFSYVVTENPNLENITKIINYANSHDFTHVRMVNDIIKPVSDLTKVRDKILTAGVNDKLVIWQNRQYYSAGVKQCLISLLKPVISADGTLYPCCGTQYAQPVPARDYGKSMTMGSIDDIETIWDKQEHFDGSGCIKCYYTHYNTLLAQLINDVEHGLFV